MNNLGLFSNKNTLEIRENQLMSGVYSLSETLQNEYFTEIKKKLLSPTTFKILTVFTFFIFFQSLYVKSYVSFFVKLAFIIFTLTLLDMDELLFLSTVVQVVFLGLIDILFANKIIYAKNIMIGEKILNAILEANNLELVDYQSDDNDEL